MDLNVFHLNQAKRLETSSAQAFFDAHQTAQSPYWIDIGNPDPTELAEFLSPLRLHPLILEGCLDPAASPRVVPHENALFLKLPIQDGWDTRQVSDLSIICLAQAIITVHRTTVPALEHMAAEFSAAVRFHAVSPSAILYQILDRLIDEDMASSLAARRELDALEEAMDEAADTVQIDQILAYKRRVAHLAATYEDQRYCVTTLQTIESEVFDITTFREYFRDSLAHLESTLRSVGRQQTHLAELHQHYLLMLQDKTNKRLRLLTILSAVFMPLTLIAGIYGMNFRYMPELGWLYGYPLVIVVMGMIAGGLVWLFFRTGWFK